MMKLFKVMGKPRRILEFMADASLRMDCEREFDVFNLSNGFQQIHFYKSDGECLNCLDRSGLVLNYDNKFFYENQFIKENGEKNETLYRIYSDHLKDVNLREGMIFDNLLSEDEVRDLNRSFRKISLTGEKACKLIEKNNLKNRYSFVYGKLVARKLSQSDSSRAENAFRKISIDGKNNLENKFAIYEMANIIREEEFFENIHEVISYAKRGYPMELLAQNFEFESVDELKELVRNSVKYDKDFERPGFLIKIIEDFGRYQGDQKLKLAIEEVELEEISKANAQRLNVAMNSEATSSRKKMVI